MDWCVLTLLSRLGVKRAMPLVKTTAIVLRSHKWGDADRIVTLYSKDLGKLRGIARGARRQKSRFGAAIEPFSVCRLNLFEKIGDPLFRISHVDLVRSSHVLREDLRSMASAARMVNLVAAITPDGDPDPLCSILWNKASLRSTKAKIRPLRRSFFRSDCWD